MESWFHFSGNENDESVSATANNENGGKNSELKVFSNGEEKPSSLVAGSNGRNSSVVDLKLGSASDQNQQETLSLNSSTANHSSKSTAKRAQIPFCQVFGCKKDLRLSKDYHKRHRVCEVHSKTAKVIVSGVEQRFCQQCSRFHLLAEFDNEKRSCRRRLAGHNERRRKPRVELNSIRFGMFRPYNGPRLQDTNSTSSIVKHQQKHEAYGKIEQATDYSPQMDNPATSERLHSKSVPISDRSRKQPFPLHVENSALTGSKIDEINESSMQDYTVCSDICSSSLFHCLGSKYSMYMDSSSCVCRSYQGCQTLPMLSLFCHPYHETLQEHTPTLPLVTSATDASYDSSKVSKNNLLTVNHEASTTGMSKASHSLWLNSGENF